MGGRAGRCLATAPQEARGGAPDRRGRQGPWATRLPTRGARRCRCRCLLRLPPMAAGTGSLALALSAAVRPADWGAAARQRPPLAARPAPELLPLLAALLEPFLRTPAGPAICSSRPRRRARARAAAVAAGEGRGDGAHARGGGERGWWERERREASGAGAGSQGRGLDTNLEGGGATPGSLPPQASGSGAPGPGCPACGGPGDGDPVWRNASWDP